MSTVKEIETAIRELPRMEFMALANRVASKQEGLLDPQMDSDAAAGKLDFLFVEGQAEDEAGQLREWPNSGH